MAQTTYTLDPPVGFHGQEYDLGTADAGDHISALATEDIPFGSVVVRAAGAHNRCKLPATAAEVTDPGSVLGIALFDSTLPQASTATVGAYPSGSRVTILHVGRVRIRFEDAVANGAALFVRVGGTGTRGAIRGAAAGGDTAALAGANAYIGAGAGALGVVEIQRRGV